MIPKEALEAAGYAKFGDEVVCDLISEDLLRAALEAAAPFIAAEALQDAADMLELPGTSATGYYSSGDHAGYQEAEGHAETWLRARAAAARGEG